MIDERTQIFAANSIPSRFLDDLVFRMDAIT